MRWLLIAGLIAASSLAGQSPEGAEDQFLERVRQVMVHNLDSLPNYACRQTVDRQVKVGKAKQFRNIDKLRTEVAFLQGKELYATTGAGGFEDKDFSDLAANAAIATGSFALYSTNLFRGKAAIFTYTGESRVNGRKVARYDFRVPVDRSRFEIRVGTRIAVVGYAGHFLADLLTGDVVRLEVHGQDLPPELSLSQLSHVFEYKRVRIGDAEPLLTRRAEMSTLGVSRDTFKRPHAVQFKNVTLLDSCRRFTAESSIFATDSTMRFEDKRSQ